MRSSIPPPLFDGQDKPQRAPDHSRLSAVARRDRPGGGEAVLAGVPQAQDGCVLFFARFGTCGVVDMIVACVGRCCAARLPVGVVVGRKAVVRGVFGAIGVVATVLGLVLVLVLDLVLLLILLVLILLLLVVL